MDVLTLERVNPLGRVGLYMIDFDTSPSSIETQEKPTSDFVLIYLLSLKSATKGKR